MASSSHMSTVLYHQLGGGQLRRLGGAGLHGELGGVYQRSSFLRVRFAARAKRLLERLPVARLWGGYLSASVSVVFWDYFLSSFFFFR